MCATPIEGSEKSPSEPDSDLHQGGPGQQSRATMASWFYIDLLATQQGPFDESTLLDLNRSGELKAKSLVWREGLEGWIPFREIAADLFTHLVAEKDAAEGTGSSDPPKVSIGVCAHSGRVYPAGEMLTYGAALIGPDFKDDFLQRLMEGGAEEIADATERTVDYVGFWWRTLSSLLDYLIKMIPSGLFMVPYYISAVFAGSKAAETDPESFQGMTGMSAAMALAYGFGVLGTIGFSIAYETWMVGKYQGTLGKLIIGARVVNPDGSRLTYKRAFVRWLAKKPLNFILVFGPSTLGFGLVVALTVGMAERGDDNGASVVLAMMTGLFAYAALLALCSGVYWMAAFDPEKRTLHDRISATRVVKK